MPGTILDEEDLEKYRATARGICLLLNMGFIPINYNYRLTGTRGKFKAFGGPKIELNPYKDFTAGLKTLKHELAHFLDYIRCGNKVRRYDGRRSIHQAHFQVALEDVERAYIG